MGRWNAADVPPQTGRTFVVTGANSGIGLATTRELVRAGARVVMAVRDTTKGAAAAATFRGLPGTAEVRTLDLVSIHKFAAGVGGPVDVLINNAGLPGGSYIGPDGLGEVAGAPRPVGSSAASHDRAVARALWDRAVELTDVRPDVASSTT